MESDLDRIAYETITETARMNFILKEGVTLLKDYNLIADAVENFEVHNDDVWVCGFPKTGTTWTQEMVWCITHDADLETTKTLLNERFPQLEFSVTIIGIVLGREKWSEMVNWIVDSVGYCNNLPRPRHIKCHLPFHLLPRQIRTGEKKPKIVYVARNPKDTCISQYHFSKLMRGYCGSFEEFCLLFLGDRLNYAPYWNHILEFWEKSKSMDNLLFLKFEDMKADLPYVIAKTASFLNKHLNDTQVKSLTEHLSFASMRKNPWVNKMNTVKWLKETKTFGDFKIDGEFIRNGNVGQWKEKMSDEMIERFDKWIADNLKNHPDYVP